MNRGLVTITSVAAIAIGATFAFAQNLDVIKLRRQTMQTVAAASGKNFGMMTDKAPFDLATVQAGLKTFQEQMPKFKGMFPDDSKTGGETEALPKIWTDKAGFDAAADTLLTAAAAAAAAIKDDVSFKAEYPKVASTCANCHKAADGYTIRLGDSFKKPKP